MRHRPFNWRFESALTAVLWLALGGTAPLSKGFLGAGLAAAMAYLLGLLVFFLGIWAPAAWLEALAVVLAAAAAQTAWLKIHLPPWWALAALGVVLPMAENLRSDGGLRRLARADAVFFMVACAFLLARHLLERSALGFLGEHPAGIFLVLGLLALGLQMTRPMTERPS